MTVPQTGQVTPAINLSFEDDVYGASIQRVSEPVGNSATWVRHEYSRRPAFNVDSSTFIMMGDSGFWSLHSIDAQNQVAFDHQLPSPMTEPNWHPTDPNRFRYFSHFGADLNLLEYEIKTRNTTQIADFTDRLPWSTVTHIWTKEEGQPSADGKIWCLMAEDDAFQTLGIFAYDLENDQILGTLSLAEDIDHVSTSPSGNYCVPSSVGAVGIRAYPTDFSSHLQLHHTSEHSDLAIDPMGQDVLVFANYSSGWIEMVDLATGTVTQLVNIYETSGAAYALHISGNSFQRPGYVVLSTYSASLDHGSTPAQYGDIWGHDRLAILELRAQPTVYNVAYLHNAVNGYWTEPHATVNQDLTRILFASTWEQPVEGLVRTYMVTFASDGLFQDGFETGDLSRWSASRRLP